MFDQRLGFYDIRVDPTNSNNPASKFIRMIGSRKRVLEVGCATGYLSAYLTQQLGCEVVGIELNPQAAELARQHCASVIVGDVEKDAFKSLSGLFDVILFGDVLEHLVCPGAVLSRCKDYLAQNGCILISMPNVAHYSIRIHLLLGRFNYQEYGLLDRTHLRFFTLRTARQLIEEAGYQVADFDVVYSMRGTRLVQSSQRLERFLKNHFAEVIGFQFIFRAVKRPGDGHGTLGDGLVSPRERGLAHE